MADAASLPGPANCQREREITMTIWAIVPVKPMRLGKSRLARILTVDERARLTAQLLARTLEILDDVPEIERTLVISRDAAVLKIARQHHASTFGEGEKQDLNLAITRAAHVAAAQRARGILILPADLPFLEVEDVSTIVSALFPRGNLMYANGAQYRQRAIAIASDRHNDGTNALLVCPPTGFTFRYGTLSFDRHLEEAQRLGMAYHIVDSEGLKFDIDTEKDWYHYRTMLGEYESDIAQQVA